MKRLFQRAAALLCAALLLVAAPPVHAAGEDPFTVLFIGVDTSGKAGRSDVMMLASIDPQAGRIRLVCVPARPGRHHPRARQGPA